MFKEKYGTVSKVNGTQVQLADSMVKVGGRWTRTGLLNLVTSTGLDTGSVAASSFYYLYAVLSGGSVVLKASLSAQKPLGFSSYKKVGAFYTDSSSNVFKTYNFSETNTISFAAYINSNATVASQSSPSFITGVSSGGTGIYDIDITAANLSLYPLPTGGVVTSDTGHFLTRTTLNPTAVRFYVRTGANALINDDFAFALDKQGVDAIQPDWKDY